MGLTRITNTVIASGAVSQDKLSANANTQFYDTVYRANDYITFVQLNANINVVSDNSSANPDANDFNTFTSLTANINQVQDNVTAGAALISFINTNSSINSANVYFVGSPTTPSTANNITVTIDGVTQSQDQWVLNSGNNTVQFTDSALQSGLEIHIAAWHT